jgi:hypothetical protein
VIHYLPGLSYPLLSTLLQVDVLFYLPQHTYLGPTTISDLASPTPMSPKISAYSEGNDIPSYPGNAID